MTPNSAALSIAIFAAQGGDTEELREVLRQIIHRRNMDRGHFRILLSLDDFLLSHAVDRHFEEAAAMLVGKMPGSSSFSLGLIRPPWPGQRPRRASGMPECTSGGKTSVSSVLR